MLLWFQDFIWTISNYFYPKENRIDVFHILFYSKLLCLFGKFIFNFTNFLFNKFA